MRVPITRHDVDGTVVDGTAALVILEDGTRRVHDFRSLDGEPLVLPPGSSFVVTVDAGVGS